MELLFERIARRADRAVTPERSNIHLATSDGKRDPLTLYREGGFDEWQRFQGGKRRAFTRSFVVAVIKTETRHHWLLAGVYDVVSEQKRQIECHEVERWGWPPWVGYVYQMSRRRTCDKLEGVIVRFERRYKNPFRLGENVAPMLEVHEEDQTI